jgi:hypothetical protein
LRRGGVRPKVFADLGASAEQRPTPQAAIHGVDVWDGTIAAKGGHHTAGDKGWGGACSLGGRGFAGCAVGSDSAITAAPQARL